MTKSLPLVVARLVKHIESLGWTQVVSDKEIPFLIYYKEGFPRLRLPVDNEAPDFGERLQEVIARLKEYLSGKMNLDVHIMLCVDDAAQADSSIFSGLLTNAKTIGFVVENIFEQIGVIEGRVPFEYLYQLSKLPHVHSVDEVERVDLA